MSIETYRKKRQFSGTPEPKGAKPKKTSSKELRFIVQKHDATRLHYDFRLELNGVYKSWAIPKGFSLNPSEQRLAIFVEDHPLEYGKFEGIIPKGHYGAGTVMLWDKGTYVERSAKSKAESESNMAKGLLKGHITFVLDGEKLKGEFALVRIKDKKSHNMWLLVKKRDQYASYLPVSDDSLSVISNRDLKGIQSEAKKTGQMWVPRKGPKKPVTEKKPIPSAMPRIIASMRPVLATRSLKDTQFEKNKWLVEPCDFGTRVIAIVQPTSVNLISARGMPLDSKQYATIASALKSIKRAAIFDGELVQDSDNKKFYISDLLFYDGIDYRSCPLSERKSKLQKLKIFDDTLIALSCQDVKNSNDSAKTLAKSDISSNAVVFKYKDSSYTPGISNDWLKFKITEELADQKPKQRFTNLDKVFWPDLGLTKGDLINYYESVAEWILPYLKDRPLSLNRHPNGIHGESFYQKDLTGYVPKWIGRERIYSVSSKKSIDFALCQNEASLLYFANLGCIEVNPWLARRPNLETPDWCVFDIDPNGQNFSNVTKVALAISTVLKKIKIKSFVKTSGSKGLHIYIRLNENTTFDQSRKFALKVCGVVERDFLKISTLERNPQKRHGKIYLDCLQNRRGQTLAAPYCLRPTEYASVSTPLSWDELKKGVHPKDFTIKNTVARLKKRGDLWQELLEIQGIDLESVDISKLE